MRVCTSCRLPENHNCQELAFEKLERKAKREQGEAVPMFKNAEGATTGSGILSVRILFIIALILVGIGAVLLQSGIVFL